ncbi:hypothetical protein MTW84_10745 [Mammaliicoccus sciuri]|uniref:hypothetical protein n=1 Tax=Mammaliicoccus sciuri TaxID=1296 RepID=UPI00066E7A33|nr:hypothetical protein [Mammaliicoccus sciuri]MCD3218809.1 hypothetical protein [Mammaliicoccus sciuri]MCJ0909662.1 hypothetical protein [Mammaliicoccus sciuri]MCJ1761427.1 hypothetical protein [Mammaliicoccus sciuri]MDO0950965.1 hypothetical protein [Mammaliicoccus sciuri]
MKKLMVITSILVLLCAACSSEKEKSSAHHKDESSKTESKQHDNSKKDNSKTESQENENKQSKNETKANEEKPKQTKNITSDVNDVSDKTKLALAFFADEDGKYIVTKDEVLTGIFAQFTQGEIQKKRLYKLVLIEEKNLYDVPSDMKFYSVYPIKGNFSSIVGLSKDKLFVGGTQSALIYKDLLKTGKEYNLQDLYDQNKNYTSLEEVANQIEIRKEYLDDQTIAEYLEQESPGTDAHFRSQVYGMLSDFEGEPIGQSKYLIDIVRHDKNGKWYVNYRNEHGEILGTYTTEGEDIVKKDMKGNIIEKKHIENRYQ